MPILRFNEADHRYFLDGTELPSVTRILAPLHNFDGIPPDVLQHAADRGRAVHKAIELDLLNELDEDALHPEIVPYVKAWRKFYMEWEPELVSSEQQVYHPTLRYAGTLDIKFRARGSLYYGDFKATAQIPPTVRLQLKAYQEADQAMLGNPDTEIKRAVLWLKNDETYKFLEQPDTDWPMFLQLLTQYHVNQQTTALISKWKELK